MYYQRHDKSQDGNFSARRKLSIQESFSILENEYFPILSVGAALTPELTYEFRRWLTVRLDFIIDFLNDISSGAVVVGGEAEDYGNMKI